MRKYAYLFLTLFIAVVYGCKEQDELKGADTPMPSGEFIEGGTFVKLQDNGTTLAGELTITADVPSVSVTWITGEGFNLDTSQSTVNLENGKGVLPIKWQGETQKGIYAPINMAYRAWVMLTVAGKQQSIPIIWKEGEVDATKLNEQVSTRVDAVDDPPRVASIRFIPTTASMSADRGTNIIMQTTNVNMVIMDYSGFKPSYNVDLSTVEDIVTDAVKVFSFKWKNGTPAANGFEAVLTAHCAELAGPTNVTITWEPEIITPPAGTLTYASSNLPAGNIPAVGGTYTFTFTGTYTDGVQLRASMGTTVLATGAEVTNKQPEITIPANPGAATRDITFQYKRADGTEWIEVGAATNRTQDGTNGGGTDDGSVVPGIIVPGGDIPDEGGTYYCNFTGTYTGAIIYRAISGTTEIARASGNMPSLLSLSIPGITGEKQRTVSFQYSKDGGNTWVFIESKLQILEYLGVNAIEPAFDIPATGGTYTCNVTGTYSKKVNVHAVSNGIVIASGSTTVPGNVQLAIPAYSGATNRLVIFEYSKSNGPWNFMEVKRQSGN